MSKFVKVLYNKTSVEIWMSISGSPPPRKKKKLFVATHLSILFAGTYLYTWVERGTMRVKCLAQVQNAIIPARAETQTVWSLYSALTITPTSLLHAEIQATILFTYLFMSSSNSTRIRTSCLPTWRAILQVENVKGNFHDCASWNRNGIITVHIVWVVVRITRTCQWVVNDWTTTYKTTSTFFKLSGASFVLLAK